MRSHCFCIFIVAHHEKANTSATKRLDNLTNLRAERVDDRDETDESQARLGMLLHFVLEVAGSLVVLDARLAHDLASKENAALALATPQVLLALERGAGLGIEGLRLASACRVITASSDEDIRSTLDRQETETLLAQVIHYYFRFGLNSRIVAVPGLRLLLGKSLSEDVAAEDGECADHVLVLAVEGELVGLLPALSDLADGIESLREPDDGLVCGVAVDGAFLNRLAHASGIELGTVAEGRDHTQLADAAWGVLVEAVHLLDSIGSS